MLWILCWTKLLMKEHSVRLAEEVQIHSVQLMETIADLQEKLDLLQVRGAALMAALCQEDELLGGMASIVFLDGGYAFPRYQAKEMVLVLTAAAEATEHLIAQTEQRVDALREAWEAFRLEGSERIFRLEGHEVY